MLKKIASILFVLLLSICVVGCSQLAEDTPRGEVKEYLEMYVKNDEEVIGELDDYADEETNLNDDQKEVYKEVLKRQYSDLKYEIEDEVIDGDTATVTVNITVYDLYQAQNDAESYLSENADEFEAEDGTYDESLYYDYRLKQMKETTTTVSYTIEFNLTKIDNEWEIEQPNEEVLAKIHGIYNYDNETAE